MKRNVNFRNKVTWYSFAFSLLVIWIHAYNAELFLGSSAEGSVAMMVETFLGERIGQIAVPGFFMISGYLFFRDFTWNKLPEKWERRIRSVLVPYILWNAVYYAGYLIASRLPWLDQTVGKGTIPFTLSELVDAVLHYKYNPVFWYLYQLIILILLAPVLYAAFRHVWSSWLWFAIVWVLIILEIDIPYINEDALLYYSSAASLALHKRWLVEGIRGQKRSRRSIGEQELQRYRRILSLLLLVIAAAAGEIGFRFAVPACLVLCRLTAVGGLWFLVPANVFPKAGAAAGYNFFLYATHFAVVRLVNKSAARLICLDGCMPLVRELIPMTLYFLMPVLVLGTTLFMVSLLRRFAPGFCRILNGGRFL